MDKPFIAEQVKFQRGSWHIKNRNVPAECEPVSIANTTSEAYANTLTRALNITLELVHTALAPLG